MAGIVIALFDTNIVIDALNGFEVADKEYMRYDSVYISIITWMEVMVGAKDDTICRQFLRDYFILQTVNNDIAEQAVRLRKQKRIKLPDAIILATARVHDVILVTRNTRDFSQDEPDVYIPYTL